MCSGAPSRASIHHDDEVNSVPLVSAEVMTTCRALTAYCSFPAGEVCSGAQRLGLPCGCGNSAGALIPVEERRTIYVLLP